MFAQNIIGPQVRRLRVRREWTQDVLATKCNLAGWDLSRGTLAKIEAQVRCVTDAEAFALAKVLRVELMELYPASRAEIWKVLGMKDEN